ncbi:MAG: PaaI family thioesterase [Leptospiraceae bacterium]|nr:PaaI family thioesterase [Leptospiraceae bacterium]
MSNLNKEQIEEFLFEMKENMKSSPIPVRIPPPSFTTMKAEMVEYVKNKSLIVSFPVEDYQTNPAGYMQGGFIAAAFDNVYGPLSYMIAKRPTTTIDMNIQYIRAVNINQRVSIEAKLIAKGFTTLHMSAEMIGENGKLLATSTTNLLVLRIPSSVK